VPLVEPPVVEVPLVELPLLEVPLVELPLPEVPLVELPPDVPLVELPLPEVELPLVEVPLVLEAAITWAEVAGAALPHPARKIGAEIAATFKSTKTETFFLIVMGLTRGIGYVEHVSWSPSFPTETVVTFAASRTQ
jgi:hypothetical protein